jgi:hypothetical protein
MKIMMHILMSTPLSGGHISADFHRYLGVQFQRCLRHPPLHMCVCIYFKYTYGTQARTQKWITRVHLGIDWFLHIFNTYTTYSSAEIRCVHFSWPTTKTDFHCSIRKIHVCVLDVLMLPPSGFGILWVGNPDIWHSQLKHAKICLKRTVDTFSLNLI